MNTLKNGVKLYKVNVSEVTLNHYGYTAKAIKEFFGSKPLQKINRHDYQEFLNKFGDNKAEETVEKEITIFEHVLRMQWKMILFLTISQEMRCCIIR